MTRREHALNKQCALNSEVRLITRVYGILQKDACLTNFRCRWKKCTYTCTVDLHKGVLRVTYLGGGGYTPIIHAHYQQYIPDKSPLTVLHNYGRPVKYWKIIMIHKALTELQLGANSSTIITAKVKKNFFFFWPQGESTIYSHL